MEEENINKSEKVVNISPIFKGKRILLFLADFFLTFIVTFVVFNVVVMPISNAICHATEREENSNSAAINQFLILYNEEVMHHEDDSDKYFYNSNVEFTMNCYLSYYSFLDSDVLNEHPQYGHKEENEVIKHFYFDIRNDKSVYLTNLQEFNKTYDYFVIEGESISLKDNIKNEIKLSFFSPNDMSNDGKTYLANLQNEFMNLYADVFKDIEKNDLVHNGNSYLEHKAIVDKAEKNLQWQLCISAAIAYFLSVAIYYLVIPMFNKESRTLGMMMMKLQRIGTNNLYLLNKSELILYSIYMLAFNLAIAFFMPMTYVTFTYLFNIPVLLPLLFIGVVLCLASLILILASRMNRSICDFLSMSVIIRNDDLDAIYRSKGYDI